MRQFWITRATTAWGESGYCSSSVAQNVKKKLIKCLKRIFGFFLSFQCFGLIAYSGNLAETQLCCSYLVACFACNVVVALFRLLGSCRMAAAAVGCCCCKSQRGEFIDAVTPACCHTGRWERITHSQLHAQTHTECSALSEGQGSLSNRFTVPCVLLRRIWNCINNISYLFLSLFVSH